MNGDNITPMLEFVVVENFNQWTTTCVPVPVRPLVVEDWSSQIDDDANPDSNGDGDTIIEPSETIEYNPALINFSQLDAELVHGTLENLEGYPGINIWNDVLGVSDTVVDNSWWNYQFNQPQPIMANSFTPMYPQFDFVFDYNENNTYQFDLHLVLGGGFKLFGSVDTALIMWSTPAILNPGYPQMSGGCSGLSIAVTATNESVSGLGDGTCTVNVSGGTPPYTYLWTNNEITPSITGLVPGNYSVIVIDANGCQESGLATVGTGADPCLNYGVWLSGVSESQIDSSDGEAEVFVGGGTPPYTYLWNTGDTASLLTGLGSGTYSVTVVDANSCVDNDSIVLTSTGDTVSIEEIKREFFVIYPNPNNGTFQIRFSEQETREVEIYDMLGKVIWRNRVTGYSTEVAIRMDSGIYFVRTENQMTKVVVR